MPVTPPRPDQRPIHSAPGQSGSMSGGAELGTVLAYPGVPGAVPNLTGASLFQQNVSQPTVVTLPAAGRIWAVVLAYVITSNATFALSTIRTVASVQLAVPGPNLVLAVVQLGVANPNQHDSGTDRASFPGLPVQAGVSVQLNVNNGNVVANLDQQASVSVLYSTP